MNDYEIESRVTHSILNFIVHDDNRVEKVKYPLRDELRAAVGFDMLCPYRYFLHNVQQQVSL